MSTIQGAAELNNEGVSLLVNGDEQCALQAFKRSLVIMKSSINDEGCGGQLSSAAGCESSVYLSSAVLPGCKQNQSYIYSRAIIIRCKCESSDEKNIVTAAIIFNMALVFQILDSRFRSSSNQTRALRLYEMCNGLLETCTADNHTAAGILAIACLNNMSQVLYDRGDFCRNQLVLGNLQYLMNATLDWSIFDDHDIQGIMLNVMMMHWPNGAGAA
jgi:hypothetical protein